MQFYVYTYREPAPSTRIFYVGKGKEGRAWWHLYRKDRHPLTHKLNKLKAADLEPVIDIWPATSEAHALDMEIRLIALLGRKLVGGGTLLNLASGGEGGCAGYGFKRGPLSEERKEIIRQANLGRKMSPEAIAKTRAAVFGKKRSPEFCAKCSVAFKGRILTAEHKAKIGKASRKTTQAPEWRERQSALMKAWWANRKLKSKEQP